MIGRRGEVQSILADLVEQSLAGFQMQARSDFGGNDQPALFIDGQKALLARSHAYLTGGVEPEQQEPA